MQDTVEVIINADGKSCTTLNPYGWKRPEEFKTYQCDSIEYKNRIHLIKLYDQSESERKTYEIEGVKFMQNGAPYLVHVYAGKDAEYKYLTTGSIHKAQIINGKAVIL